jgi:hypothetical protein
MKELYLEGHEVRTGTMLARLWVALLTITVWRGEQTKNWETVKVGLRETRLTGRNIYNQSRPRKHNNRIALMVHIISKIS